jgi:hypothetical protein
MRGPDLLQNFLPQAHAGMHVGERALDDLTHGELSSFAIQIEAGEFDLRLGVVVVREVASPEIVGRPGDDVGPREFIAEVQGQVDGQFGSRIGDPDFNLKFFDTAFHVRSFASVVGLDSHLDPAPGAKGRPAVQPERAA